MTAAEIFLRHPFLRLTYVVGPKYEAAHKEMDYLFDFFRRIGATQAALFSRPRQGKIALRTFDGATIETLSSEDGAKAITGTGESPDFIAMVEAGKQSYDIYLACVARVARSRGTLLLSGTIEETNRWYPELYSRWQVANTDDARSFCLPTWTNAVSYPGGRDDPAIKHLEAIYTPDKFQERFGAIPCPPATLVFREFSFADHVKPAPFWTGERADEPVELAIDPGYVGGYAVLAIQWQGDTVWVIDEVYLQHAVAEEVIAECKARQWWGQVRGGVIDIAGRQHQGLPSHVEIWQNQAQVYLRSNYVRIADGIARHRTFLRNPLTGKPRLFLDPRAKQTCAEYGRYKYREVVEGRPTSEEPIDDVHAIKAIGYWLYDHFGAADVAVEPLKELPFDNAFRFIYNRSKR